MSARTCRPETTEVVFFRATNANRSVVRGTRGRGASARSDLFGRSVRRAMVPASFRSPGTGTAGGVRAERAKQAKREKETGRGVGRKEEGGGGGGKDRPWGRAGRLLALPHKYGFSRAVYDRKRVEPREPRRA